MTRMGEMTADPGSAHDSNRQSGIAAKPLVASGDNFAQAESQEKPVVKPASRTTLMLLVLMTGIAPVSLYMLVPILPQLATLFFEDISIAQMTVSFYMVGMALSQLAMGPLSDRFGRRPVLLCCFGLVVIANIGCILAQTLPQLIIGRFLQAVGGASGMVISRAIIRDIYDRSRVGSMISLVIAVMMIAQMMSPLVGGMLDAWFGWRSVFYVLTAVTVTAIVSILVALPETRRIQAPNSDRGFFKDVRALSSSRSFIGYVLCQTLASSIIFTFAGGGPYLVINHMGRSSAEYGMWFATAGFAYMIGNLASVRWSSRHGLERMIWLGLAIQLTGSLVNACWGVIGLNQMPAWLFGTHMIVMFGNAFAMANASAAAISVRPQASGTASGAMGFLQMGFGALCSQLGAYLGGHFTTPLPLNAAILMLSIACAAAIVLLAPQRKTFMPDTIIAAEEPKADMV